MEMQTPISDSTAFPPLYPPALPLTHRRSISDLDLRLPDDINFLDDPLDVPSETFQKMAAAEGDDILASYVNLDCFGEVGSKEEMNGLDRAVLEGEEEICDSDGSGGYGGVWEAVRRSQSVDCLNGIPSKERKKLMEPKKAMSPDKLAELWIVDPKRAKRIMANRQSAARSKERKAYYVMELEKKLQSLQTQATTLSVQHSLFERDTTSLNAENVELRRELEFMEQQAQLRNALNDALESELERLKVATGEKPNSDAYTLTVQQQTAYKPAFSLKHRSYPPNPSDLPKAKKPKLSQFEQELYSFNQTNTFTPQQPIPNTPIATKIPHMNPLDTNFPTSCQPLYANPTSQAPMLVPITQQGIDVGGRDSCTFMAGERTGAY